LPAPSKTTVWTYPKGLRDALAAAGAHFETFRGREVPMEFSGVEDEYRASRENVVVGDRSYRAAIHVTGKDRSSFIQNMLTNDVKRLAPGQGMAAAMLTRKGTLIADLVLYQLDDALWLEMEPEGLGPALDSLSRYIVSEDVTLRDVSKEQAILSVEGPKAAALLARLLQNTAEGQLASLPPFHFLDTTCGELAIRTSAAGHGPAMGFDLAVDTARAPDLVARLLNAGRPLEARLVGWRAQEIRRIEAGIPLLGIDMDDSHLPLEAGLDSAISFTKGCYIGQEYVVRLAHRGHLNRKLTGLALSGPVIPEAGSEIRGAAPDHPADEKEVGRVTSAAFSPGLGHAIALGYVQTAFATPDTAVTVLSGGRVLDARVTHLPFIEQA